MGAALTPNGPDLAFAIGLPPEKAVEHLRAKGLQVSEGWRTVNEAAHARAFTVAHVTRLDVLKDIQDELLRAQEGGHTIAQFRATLVPALERKGWFAHKGQPVRVPDGTPPDPETGELATYKRLTARRLQTIFQTNMQSSMMAARYRELMANADKRPWFQYVAVLDGRTRPAHRAMNGRVFRYDDAGWSTWWPPCGWNCRCRVRALDQADLDDKGLVPEASKGHLRASEVPMPDGSTSRVTRYTPADGGASFAPDPGFNGNPAQVQAADRLLVLKMPQVLPADLAAQQLRQVFTAAPRVDALRTFVETAREARQPLGATFAVGALDDAAVLKLVGEGAKIDQALPLTVEDRLIGGVKAGRHAAAGDALAIEDWANLPAVLAYGELLWDAGNGTLIYAAPALVPKGERLWLRIAVKAGTKVNDIRHAALVKRDDLGGYTVVRKAVPRE